MKPSFAKDSVSTFTFDRAADVDVVEDWSPHQIVGMAEGGTVKVKDFSGDLQHIFQFNFIFTSYSSVTNLKDFFNDPLVNWQANTFTYNAEEGSTFTVRLMQSGLSAPRMPGNRWAVSLILRDES